jgi:hypothetical protein
MSRNFKNVIPTHEGKCSSTDKSNYFITLLFCAWYPVYFILQTELNKKYIYTFGAYKKN